MKRPQTEVDWTPLVVLIAPAPLWRRALPNTCPPTAGSRPYRMVAASLPNGGSRPRRWAGRPETCLASRSRPTSRTRLIAAYPGTTRPASSGSCRGGRLWRSRPPPPRSRTPPGPSPSIADMTSRHLARSATAWTSMIARKRDRRLRARRYPPDCRAPLGLLNAVSGGRLYHGRRISKPYECFSILGTISGGGHETQDDRNPKLRQDVRDVRPRSHRLATRPPSRAKRRSSGHRSRRDRPVAGRAGLATRSRQRAHIHGHEPTPGRGAGQLRRRSLEPQRRRCHHRPLYPGDVEIRATHRRHRGAAAGPGNRDQERGG